MYSNIGEDEINEMLLKLSYLKALKLLRERNINLKEIIIGDSYYDFECAITNISQLFNSIYSQNKKYYGYMELYDRKIDEDDDESPWVSIIRISHPIIEKYIKKCGQYIYKDKEFIELTNNIAPMIWSGSDYNIYLESYFDFDDNTICITFTNFESEWFGFNTIKGFLNVIDYCQSKLKNEEKGADFLCIDK